MNKTHYIYTLQHPTSSEVFYVGCTSSPEARLREHLDPPFYDFSVRATYIRSLVYDPVMKVVEVLECNTEEALIAECYWIEVFKSSGAPLTNKKVKKSVQPHYLSYKPFVTYTGEKELSRKRGSVEDLFQICASVFEELRILNEAEELKANLKKNWIPESFPYSKLLEISSAFTNTTLA